VASVYLNDYIQELERVGEVVFRRRHAAQVLIVSGKAAELIERSGGRENTMVAAPSQDHAKELALMHRVFPIMKGPYTPMGPVNLGRTSDNDVAIPEYSISKRHCFFDVESGTVSISDCGSTNGTVLDGKKLTPKTPTPLVGGEVITLGRYAFLFQTAAGFLGYVKKSAAARGGARP
jgi:hypothetical protein